MIYNMLRGEDVSFYKGDTVYFLDHGKKCAFIGSVFRSDNLVPEPIPESTGDSSETSGELLDRFHDPHVPSTESNADEQGCSQKEKSNIKVTWENLLTGDGYSSPATCPVPTCVQSDQIRLIERDHMLNDTVRHAKRDVFGKIVNIRTKACGEVLSYGRGLLNLDCRRLRSVYPWTTRNGENHVIWNGWLGRVLDCHMLAIVRFPDGARLLVREEGLRQFEPVKPTSDAFPDTLFEGAWIQGDANALKANPEPSDLTALLWSSEGRTRSTGTSHGLPGAPNPQSDTCTAAEPITPSDPQSGLMPKPDTVRWTTSEESYPPGHPLNLFRDLAQSSATKPLLHTLCGKNMRLLERTPIFLTETKARNALWLSRLNSFGNVTVYVERLLPAEATVHWFANRRAAVHSNNPTISKPPPSVVRGEDLANLCPVIPYPYLSCTGSDVWYYQLQESDVMYDLKAFQCPEQLLYDWLVNNQDNLAAVRVPFNAVSNVNCSTSSVSAAGSPPAPIHTISDSQTSSPNKLDNQAHQPHYLESDLSATLNTTHAPDMSIHTSSVTNESGKDEKPESVTCLTKTTPFWAQRSLFSSAHRRNRVLVNARHRLNHKELVRWARSREREESESDTDSSDSDTSGTDDRISPAHPVHTQSAVHSMNSSPQASGETKVVTHEPQDPSDKWTMNTVLHKCASLITSLRTDNPQSHPSDAKAGAGDHSSSSVAPNNTVSDSEKCDCTRKLHASAKKISKNESEAIRFRESQLPPLRPGSWVPVAIYTTYTTYDVRWQDGTFERDIPCQDLLPVYFNIDEHEFFPGSLVSLKSSIKSDGKDTSQSTGNEDNSSRNPRDFGVVLSANSKDRVCSVQWFVPDANADPSNSGSLVPMGPPEEAGVYELVALVDRQLGYGDILLMHTPNDPLHVDFPAGYLEDIIPETGKLVIRWIDGQTTEVTRSECLFPLDALMDDDEWSDDDSDELESNDLSTDSDSDWSTVSSVDSSVSSGSEKNRKPVTEEEDQTDAQAAEFLAHETTARRQAALNVVLAYQRTAAARSLFVDQRTFVFWILRRFVVVPDELDTVVDQLGTLLAAAATAADQEPKSVAVTSESEPSTQSAETESSDKPPFAGRLLQPARAWDYTEETVAIQVVEKLISVRELIRTAYQAVHDCRIKRMYAKCDHRELFSEKHVEGILRSIEISGSAAVQTELCPTDTPNSSAEAVCTNPTDTESMTVTNAQALSNAPVNLAVTDSITDQSNALNSDIVMAMRRSRMKVLIVPNSTQPFTTSVDNWRDRIHYSLVKSDSEEGGITAYMIVSANLFDQLTRYLTMVHRRLLEQLTDFEACALAWLGECAPELVAKAKSLSETDDEIQMTDLFDVKPGAENSGDAQPNEPVSDPSTGALQTGPNAQVTDEMVKSAEFDPQNEPSTQTTGTTTVKMADTFARSCSVPSVDEIPAEFRGQFVMEVAAPSTHRFYRSPPDNLPKPFYKAWKRDNTLLSTSLPRGIIVKAFDDRIDLYSLLIVGPAGTPYEHALFLFDVQLPARYPSVPPQVHYHSFASERVNPNLYVKGHVCLSLLGTWAGKDSENWNAENSNLLQLVVSLQGLILNSEPYFNEAGFDACRGTPEAHERSRVYNESVIATLVQSMVQLIQNPEPVFRKEIVQHCIAKADAYAKLLEFWSSLDEAEFNRLRELQNASKSDTSTAPAKRNLLPEFPLAPISRGFQVSVRRHRLTFLQLVEAAKSNELD